MFGLDNTSGVSVMPPIADKLNANPLWFTEGGGGDAPSYPGKDWFNAIQAEIVNFIVASGLTPNKTDLTQITQAVLKSIQKSASSFATDTGVANAYVCNFTPAITVRSEGQILRCKVTNTNTGASTFNDGAGVAPLVGGAHSALQGGELVAGGDAWVQWNSTVGAGSYVLLFCTGAPMQIASGNQSQHAATVGQVRSASGNKSIIASVASNALNITVPSGTQLSFRSQILTDGTGFNVTTSAPLTLTVPSGATLGTLSASLSNLAVVALYNAGAPVLGIVNLSGGVDLSESGLITSTLISASATSSSVVYSASAVASSPYVVLGLLQATEATAGVWAAAPSTVVGRGANLISQIGGVGFAAPVDVTASRSLNTTYYNTTNRPKKVKVMFSALSTGGFTALLTVNGVVVDFSGFGGTPSSATRTHSVEWIVAPGQSYIVVCGVSISSWIEA